MTKEELSTAMRELAGRSSNHSAHILSTSDGEEAATSIGSSVVGGTVTVAIHADNLSPVLRVLRTFPEDDVTDYRHPHAALTPDTASAQQPWACELDSKEAPKHHRLLLDYGALPLSELHRHLKIFFEVQRRSLSKARSQLAKSSPFSVAALIRPPQADLRWELLKDLDLQRTVLGDSGFLPVLGLISVSSALRYLNVDRNELSLISVKRLFVILTTTPHRFLERLSVANNNFLESSGEELLRIVRTCKCLWYCNSSGNSFTPRLQDRLHKAIEYNVSLMQGDPYYILGEQWDYLKGWECIPAESLHLAKTIWAMLVASRERFVNRRDEEAEEENHHGGVQGAPHPEMYPLCVVAPLFSQIARLTSYELSKKVIADGIIQQVFSPISALEGEEERTSVYSTSYFKLITTIMNGITLYPHRWDFTASVLASVGVAHEKLGVSHLLYPIANKIFVEALEQQIGVEKFTSLHKAAMVQILALMTRTALRGTEAFV